MSGRERSRRMPAWRRPARLFGRPVVAWASAAAVLAAALLGGCATAPLSNDPKNLFARAEPATVIVQGQVSAHISTPGDWTVNEPKVRDALYAQGLTDSSPEWDSARFDVIYSNPIAYLDPDYSAAPYETDAKAGWTGSGFIADPNGYVVTNAHVAAPSDEEVKSGLVAQGLQQFIDKDVAMWAERGRTPAQLKTMAAADAEWMAHYLTVSKMTKKFSVVMGANIAGTDVTPKEITADVVAAGEAIPGKDVAIVKIEGRNYPTIPIGDDAEVNVGDKLYVIGYPGAAQGGVHQLISVESLTEPTFTSGVLSAKKRATQGFEVMQTDAAVTHGNSGGPVLDSTGKVVGLATFGSLDPSTGKEIQGYNFIMPATLVRQFLDRSGAHPAQSEFTKLYDQGLAQEASSHFKAADATFQQIERLTPGNPYVLKHVSQDEAAIAAGKDRSLDLLPMLGIGTAILIVLVGGAVAVMLVARRRATPATSAARAGPAPQEPLPATPAATPDAATESAAPVSEAGSERVTLLVVGPSGTRQVVVDPPAIIGQAADCEVTVDDPQMSDRHAAIARVNGVLEITDLGGANGIEVNENTVTISPLRQGDRIKLGGTEVVIV